MRRAMDIFFMGRPPFLFVDPSYHSRVLPSSRSRYDLVKKWLQTGYSPPGLSTSRAYAAGRGDMPVFLRLTGERVWGTMCRARAEPLPRMTDPR